MEAISNDMCSTAEPIEPAAPITANTAGAKPHGLKNDMCSLHADSRGAFYELQGTGNKMYVTFITDMPEENRMEIAVVSDDCGTCVTYSDFLTAGDTPHTVHFDSVEGETYKIVVSGERFSDAGEFQLEMEEGK